MTRNIFILFAILTFVGVQAQSYTINDPAFAAKLAQMVPDAIMDNQLDTTHPQVLQFTDMNIGNSSISDLDGIQYFTALETLYCSFNPLSYLPVLPPSVLSIVADGCSLNSLPELPPSLDHLSLAANQLTSLPSLPQSLSSLSCPNNQLNALPTLGPAFSYLGCAGNQLTSLPQLPGGLAALDCQSNEITTLPDLPASLVTLRCDDNQLTEMPPLPNGMNLVSCNTNQLTTIPNIPDSLVILYCMHNQITHLPSMANSQISHLHLTNNALTELPELPPTLNLLWVGMQPDLQCLPLLPNTLHTLSCSNTALSCLPNIPAAFGGPGANFSADFSPILCHPGNSNCEVMNQLITGHVFYDHNQNGIRDQGEPPMLLASIEAQPGDALTSPNSNGLYVLGMDPGTFVVQGRPLLHHVLTTDLVEITLDSLQIDSLNDIGYYMIPEVMDLRVFLEVGPTRPGFESNVWMRVVNVGTTTTASTVQLFIHENMTLISSTATPASVVENVATWSIVLAPGQDWVQSCLLHLPPSFPIGMPFDHVLHADPSGLDAVTEDNTALHSDVVVGSYDPNDKRSTPEAMSPDQVLDGDPIKYVIRFQNTGNYHAERVVITDTLSTDLNWSSLQFNSSSHSCEWYLTNGILHVIHDPIFLPDSIADEPNSHGYVSFSILPKDHLLHGDEVLNIANIYFDFNEPIITDPCVIPISNLVGIGELQFSPDWQIRPNPCRVDCSLFTDATMNDQYWIEILDVHGRMAQRLVGMGHVNILPTAGLPSGIYMVRVISGGVTISTPRLVIE